MKLLTKFYTEQDIITNAAVDKFPSGAYLDPKLPYTQTGINVNNRISMKNEFAWEELLCELQICVWISRWPSDYTSAKKIRSSDDYSEFCNKTL